MLKQPNLGGTTEGGPIQQLVTSQIGRDPDDQSHCHHPVNDVPTGVGERAVRLFFALLEVAFISSPCFAG
jgi:hypothetical protein